MKNINKVQMISNLYEDYYKSLKVATKEMTRYFDGGEFVSNGYWMTPKKFEPKLFRAIDKTSKITQMEKLYRETIASHKVQMNLTGLIFKDYNLLVEFKNDAFSSYINPKYLAVLNMLNHNFQDVIFWQQNALSPLLIDSNNSETLMLIMPLKVNAL